MSPSVILVDDNPGFRDLARRVLVTGGLVVLGEADTIATALPLAHDLRPDAALVDVGLPDGSGVVLAERLTALPWRVRVVLTSTDPDATSEEDLRRCGAEAFFAKDELPGAPLAQVLAGRS